MDNLGLLSSLHFPNVLLPCSPFMYSALMMASLYGCRCFMCKKNSLKRSLANCEPSLSDFSLSKCRRLDREGSSLASLGGDTSGNSSHKCAGTQTLFSSFVPIRSFYPPQPPHDTGHHDMTTEEEPRFILDLDHHMAKSSQLLLHHPTSPPPPPPPPLEAESSNAPLNLTLSPSSKSSLRSQPVAAARDSHCAGGGWTAIASDQAASSSARLSSGWTPHHDGGRDPPPPAAPLPSSSSSINHQPPSDLDKTSRSQTEHHIWSVAQDSSSSSSSTRPNTKNKQQSNSPRKITSVVTVECDKGIEEHFERSLGKDYPKCIAKGKTNSGSIGPSAESIVLSALDHVPARRNGAVQTSSPTNDTTSDGAKGNSAVSGAVDDHFAKSLGQTWTKLKSQNVQTDLRMPQPGSVDDHFAKALGQETWFKLRVKKEGT